MRIRHTRISPVRSVYLSLSYAPETVRAFYLNTHTYTQELIINRYAIPFRVIRDICYLGGTPDVGSVTH